MTSGSRSSPAMTSAGSPGNSCCSEKISTDTKNSVGISWTMRRARKFSMARSVPGSRFRSLQLQPDHTHQAVGHLLVAFELGGMRDQDAAMIEVEQGIVLQHALGQLLVDRFALRLVGDEARIGERLVGVGIGPGAVVLRRVLVHEDIGVAVG